MLHVVIVFPTKFVKRLIFLEKARFKNLSNQQMNSTNCNYNLDYMSVAFSLSTNNYVINTRVDEEIVNSLVSKHTRYTKKPVTDDEYNFKCAKDRISHRDNNLKRKMSKWIPTSIIPDILKSLKSKILESVSHSITPVSQSISITPVSQSITQSTPIASTTQPIFSMNEQVTYRSKPIIEIVDTTTSTPVVQSMIVLSPSTQQQSFQSTIGEISIGPMPSSNIIDILAADVSPPMELIISSPSDMQEYPVELSITKISYPDIQRYNTEPTKLPVDVRKILSSNTQESTAKPRIATSPPCVHIPNIPTEPTKLPFDVRKILSSNTQESSVKPRITVETSPPCVHIPNIPTEPTKLPFDVRKILSSNTQESSVKPRTTVATEQPMSDYDLIDQWFNTPAWLEPSEFSSDEKAEPMPEDFISCEDQFLSDRKVETIPESFLDKKVTPSKKIKAILSNMKSKSKSSKS